MELLLLHKVKEKGIVKIILDYKKQMEITILDIIKEGIFNRYDGSFCIKEFFNTAYNMSRVISKMYNVHLIKIEFLHDRFIYSFRHGYNNNLLTRKIEEDLFLLHYSLRGRYFNDIPLLPTKHLFTLYNDNTICYTECDFDSMLKYITTLKRIKHFSWENNKYIHYLYPPFCNCYTSINDNDFVKCNNIIKVDFNTIIY